MFRMFSKMLRYLVGISFEDMVNRGVGGVRAVGCWVRLLSSPPSFCTSRTPLRRLSAPLTRTKTESFMLSCSQDSLHLLPDVRTIPTSCFTSQTPYGRTPTLCPCYNPYSFFRHSSNALLLFSCTARTVTRSPYSFFRNCSNSRGNSPNSRRHSSQKNSFLPPKTSHDTSAQHTPGPSVGASSYIRSVQ